MLDSGNRPPEERIVVAKDEAGRTKGVDFGLRKLPRIRVSFPATALITLWLQSPRRSPLPYSATDNPNP